MKTIVLLLVLTGAAFAQTACTTREASKSANPGTASSAPATPTLATSSTAPASSFKETAKTDPATVIPYPFTTCAVIRKDYEGHPKYRRVYKNHEVLFCCTPCVKAFDANPEPYMPRIIEAAAAKARGETVNSGW